jgi:hypothetical protein
MIGIAVPSDQEWAAFDGEEKAQEVAELWRGAWQSFNVNGELEGIRWVERRYVEDGWEEYAEGGGAVKVNEQLWRCGWSLHFKAGSFLDFNTEQVEILDNTSQTLVALRYTLYTKSAPPFASKVELAFLKPIE